MVVAIRQGLQGTRDPDPGLGDPGAQRLGAGQYDLDYRVFPDGEGPRPRRVGRIDLRGLRLFESSRPKLGEKLLLGATLDSLRFDKDNEEWLFGLEPDSGVRITHTKALEALEWPSEDELQTEEKP